MIVERVPVGGLRTNAYFYVDDENTKRGVLIDPGAEADKLIAIIRDMKWIIEKILITHGHFDHIGAVGQLHQEFGIPYFIYTNGKQYLTDASYNLSDHSKRPIILNEAIYFRDGDVFNVGSSKLKVIHTPGHTADSVAFYDAENSLAFVGDTIFKDSVGATNFPGGNERQLADSILNRIFQLPNETVLYAGHFDETNVLTEKSNHI